MNKLNKIIEEDKNVVLIDCHNLIFRTLFVSENHNKTTGSSDEESYSYWKYLFLKTFTNIINQFKPDEVIVAMDERHSWRKNFYADYKANRKVARDGSKIDFEKFFPMLDKFLTDLTETLTNCKWIKVNECEGDDIIAIATKVLKDKKITIISTDRDLNQLLKNKNVKQYDPVKRKYTESLNPNVDLEVKIIMGDKGDNIPAIKPRCGIATAATIVSNGTLDELLESSEEIKKNYIRNKMLIDLEFIPQNIQNDIADRINSYTLEKLNGNKLFNFMIKHRLSSMLDNLQEVKSSFSLIDENIS